MPQRPGRRPVDIAILAFFFVNILFITYVVDVEQLTIPEVADPADFAYPIWPPRPAVDLIHWWGRTFDPLLMARPAWWKATIWIDSLFFGPFYVAAIYAWIRRRNWIRIPGIIYGSTLITIVLVILAEERFGSHPSPNFPVVLMANLPWLVMPAIIIFRLARDAHPFGQAPELR